MADRLDHDYPQPKMGEEPLAYTERVNAEMPGSSYVGLEDHFGLSNGAAKSMWIASVEFNNRFAYSGWLERKQRCIHEYGARNWLKRKYSLNDEMANKIALDFERGNERAIGENLDFEALARRLVTPKYVKELEVAGIVTCERRKEE